MIGMIFNDINLHSKSVTKIENFINQNGVSEEEKMKSQDYMKIELDLKVKWSLKRKEETCE